MTIMMCLELLVAGLVLKHFIKKSKIAKTILYSFKGIFAVFTALYLCTRWFFNTLNGFNTKMKQKVSSQTQPSVSKSKSNVVPFSTHTKTAKQG